MSMFAERIYQNAFLIIGFCGTLATLLAILGDNMPLVMFAALIGCFGWVMELYERLTPVEESECLEVHD